MNRIDRLFAIQTFLQSRRYVSVEAIAEKFNISVRTVYRDVRALCESGVPVTFEPAKGYCIVQGYFLPPVSFTTGEAAALMLMEGATRVYADQSIQQLYSAALTKIRSVLRSTQKDDIDALSAGMGMQLPSCMEANYGYLATLQTAIAEHRIVEMDYCNKSGTKSSRKVEPVGLQFYAMAWHLMAWCHRREEYRDFRVSRIEALYLTREPFVKPDHPTLEILFAGILVDY